MAIIRTVFVHLTVLVLLVSSAFVVGTASDAQAATPCGPEFNPVVCENSKTGADPDEWDITGFGDASIQGFSTDVSVNIGSRIDFKIDTDARDYTIDIFRTGWYQGLGARKVASVEPSTTLPQRQPQCVSDLSTELFDCGTWGVSASWDVPADAVSGVYVARLARTDNGGASHITFVVRNEASRADVLFQTSDTSWQAYNTYGGSNFYQGAANGRAYKISYNRPMSTRGHAGGRDFYFSSEYAQVRFLERNGYDVTYYSGVDTDRLGAGLLNHSVFLSVGHDEYWSGRQRANVEAARDAGVNLQFLSGNEMYWRTRYEPSVDGSRTDYRTLVSYKETWNEAKIDPSDEWTGTWRDPRFASQAQGGGLPENAVTGTQYVSNGSDFPVTVNAREGKLRVWRETGLDELDAGSSRALGAHIIGYEANEDVDNGFRPAGLIRLSTRTDDVEVFMGNFGNSTVPGTTTHHLTQYRAASGALVFSAGSVQWGWGLDAEHDGDGAPADARLQQAQVNLLADMDAQPSTLQGDLVAVTTSVDTTAPTTTIIPPEPGAGTVTETSVTVTGTAADADGVVAGVEVSTDSGATWRVATGTTDWSYTYQPRGPGTETVLARAIDDSANYAATPATQSFPTAGFHSVFGFEKPSTPDSPDRKARELGLRFSPTEDGFVTAVRFYKGKANTGAHTGTLWNTTGDKLASVAFDDETASGWQSSSFSAPVPVTAEHEYTVSYSAPRGRYAATAQYWAYGSNATAPLRVTGGFGTDPAGVVGATGRFPTKASEGTNYFVDIVFIPAAPAPAAPAPPADAAAPATAAVLTGPPATSTHSVKLSRGVGSTGTPVGRLWTLDSRVDSSLLPAT